MTYEIELSGSKTALKTAHTHNEIREACANALGRISISNGKHVVFEGCRFELEDDLDFLDEEGYELADRYNDLP
jgi:hypothetical protein